MPKAKVKTSYQRAASSPSERVPQSQGITDPKPRKKKHDLYTYIRDNEGTGIPVTELIEQYQLYECDHPAKDQERTGSTATFFIVRCPKCNWTRKETKPGVKASERNYSGGY